MPNYASLAATAKRLIEGAGRSIVLRKLSEVPADVTKPWRGTDTNTISVPLIGVMLAGEYQDEQGTLVRRGFREAIVAAQSVSSQLSTLALDAPGTGYSADDVITLSGGTFSTAATIRVDTVDGMGLILTFSTLNPGVYAATSPTFTQGSVAPAGGTGATFDSATFSAIDLTDFDELVDGSETWKIDEVVRVAPGSTDLVWRARLKK